MTIYKLAYDLMTLTPENHTPRKITAPQSLKHRLKRAALTLLVIVFALQGVRHCGTNQRSPTTISGTDALPPGSTLVVSPLRGVLAHLYINEGQSVTNQQAIAGIWPAEYDFSVSRARAVLEASRVELQHARLQLESTRVDSQREAQRSRMRMLAMKAQHKNQIEQQLQEIEELATKITTLRATDPREQEHDNQISQLTGRINLLEADIERRRRLLEGFNTYRDDLPIDPRVEDLETAVRISEARLTRHENQFAEAKTQREAATIMVQAPTAARIHRLPRDAGAPVQATDVIAVLINP